MAKKEKMVLKFVRESRKNPDHLNPNGYSESWYGVYGNLNTTERVGVIHKVMKGCESDGGKWMGYREFAYRGGSVVYADTLKEAKVLLTGKLQQEFDELQEELRLGHVKYGKKVADDDVVFEKVKTYTPGTQEYKALNRVDRVVCYGTIEKDVDRPYWIVRTVHSGTGFFNTLKAGTLRRAKALFVQELNRHRVIH